MRVVCTRNVATKEQLDYISGKWYQAQRNIDRARNQKGVFISNAPTEQNVQVDCVRKDTPTANNVAAIMGLTPVVVRRNVGFARGIDAIKEVSPELAEVLDGYLIR